MVRHVSGDRMVAVVEIVSPGKKSGQKAFRSFRDKAGELLDRQIHLLILDLVPPTPREPSGIHAAIWEDATGQPFAAIEGKPLTPCRDQAEYFVALMEVEIERNRPILASHCVPRAAVYWCETRC